MAVKQAYSPKEVGEILGLGRTALYAAIRSREIPSVKVGGKILIPKAAIDDLLAGTLKAPKTKAKPKRR